MLANELKLVSASELEFLLRDPYGNSFMILGFGDLSSHGIRMLVDGFKLLFIYDSCFAGDHSCFARDDSCVCRVALLGI